MDQIKLGVQSALSHSWHRYSKSLLPDRVIKSLVNAIKAFFGGYSVSVLHCITIKLMKEHPGAWLTQLLNLAKHHVPFVSVSIPGIDIIWNV